jgi:hypothetical protein
MSHVGQMRNLQSAIRNTIRGSFRYFFFGLSFFLLFLVVPVSFTAAEGDITLLLDTEEQRSDNFYRGEKDETSVYATIIKPRITGRTWTDRSSVFLAYSPTFNYYSGDSDNVDASDDDFVGHELDFMAETTFFERLKLSLTESLRKTREPGAYDIFLEGEADREKYTVNQAAPFLTYDFAEKFTAILGYRNQVYNYQRSVDSREHRGYFTIRYHFNDRNSLEVEEQYWAMRYDHQPDYESSQTQLIFRRELSDFLGCEIGGGYHDRKFESDATWVEDYDDFIYRLALTGESDLSKLFLGYRKNLNDFSKGSWYFEANRVTLNVEHTFLEKLTCSFGGYYQKNDYEEIIPGTTEMREDEIWDGFVGIRYRIRDWLSAGVSYEYTDRDSNIAEWSYSENRVYGNIRFEYSTARRK